MHIWKVSRFHVYNIPTIFSRIFGAFRFFQWLHTSIQRGEKLNGKERKGMERKEKKRKGSSTFSLFFHQLSFRLWAEKALTEKIKEKTKKIAPKKLTFWWYLQKKKDSFLSKLFSRWFTFKRTGALVLEIALKSINCF